jgi:RNA recognition motif-containing protein
MKITLDRDKEMATNKLFVGGIPWSTKSQDLVEGFEKFGPVSHAKVIKDRKTGRSMGFGFVTFEDPNDAQKAMEQMNGELFEGRELKVSEAIERSQAN